MNPFKLLQDGIEKFVSPEFVDPLAHEVVFDRPIDLKAAGEEVIKALEYMLDTEKNISSLTPDHEFLLSGSVEKSAPNIKNDQTEDSHYIPRSTAILKARDEITNMFGNVATQPYEKYPRIDDEFDLAA